MFDERDRISGELMQETILIESRYLPGVPDHLQAGRRIRRRHFRGQSLPAFRLHQQAQGRQSLRRPRVRDAGQPGQCMRRRRPDRRRQGQRVHRPLGHGLDQPGHDHRLCHGVFRERPAHAGDDRRLQDRLGRRRRHARSNRPDRAPSRLRRQDGRRLQAVGQVDRQRRRSLSGRGQGPRAAHARAALQARASASVMPSPRSAPTT